jgi:hypothetical protein
VTREKQIPISSANPLSQPWGRYFRCERVAGQVRLGDPESHFNSEENAAKLSYDVANNAMLAIHGFNGELKAVTAYRDTYLALTTGWAGVWTCKDNSTHGPYSFSLELDGTTHDLAKVDWDLRTALLDNTIPVTEFTGPGKRFIVRVVTFAPISADGSQRLRGVVYGLQLENCSAVPLSLYRGQSYSLSFAASPRCTVLTVAASPRSRRRRSSSLYRPAHRPPTVSPPRRWPISVSV